LRQERGIRRLQDQLDGQRIDHLDGLDVVDLALAQAARHRQVAVQRELHGIGVEFFAILEEHVRPQMDDEMRRVLVAVAGRELRHDVQAGIEIEEFVAHAGEDDAADIARTQRRVEDGTRIISLTSARTKDGIAAAIFFRRAHCCPSIKTPAQTTSQECRLNVRFKRFASQQETFCLRPVLAIGRQVALHLTCTLRLLSRFRKVEWRTTTS
jgi:hypothetical protein